MKLAFLFSIWYFSIYPPPKNLFFCCFRTFATEKFLFRGKKHGCTLIIFYKKWRVPPNHQFFRRRPSGVRQRPRLGGTSNFLKKFLGVHPFFFPKRNFSVAKVRKGAQAQIQILKAYPRGIFWHLASAICEYQKHRFCIYFLMSSFAVLGRP